MTIVSAENQSVDQLSVNTIRILAVDIANKANSGHPGLPMGAAPMAYVLWKNHLVVDPANPNWRDRDRFVLSPGHGSMLLYSLMHLAGYGDVTMDDLKSFRQWQSKTPGHPEFGWTKGVEATTGPLGQGSANVVGMAMAERMLAHRFNRDNFEIVNHRTWAIVSDGDLMEGLSGEAASLAGQLKLGKLICLYDDNGISLDGPTTDCFSTEDVGKRYEAYGWQVIVVKDGDTDLQALDDAINQAKSDTGRPSLIIVKTTIGYGSPNRQGTSKIHGSPLGAEEGALTKQHLGWDPELQFHVPERAREQMRESMQRGVRAHQAWNNLMNDYEKAHPDLAKQWKDTWQGTLPQGWDDSLPVFEAGKSFATRDSSGKALDAIAKQVPWLVGGNADISSSTKSIIQGGGTFDGVTGAGRNIAFGVREHAMTAIANGMLYHGGVRPFVSTFLTFADYMRPSIRVAALSHLPLIMVFSHDSLAVGEDGPTHQPVEHLASLRAMPNVMVMRPGDPNEMVEAWRWCMQYTAGPVALITTRQNLPVIDRTTYASAKGLHNGGYVLADCEGQPQVVILATGSEVSVALNAHNQLKSENIRTRVVSLPCWELFEQQPKSYKDTVLPPNSRRVAIEAGVRFGWERWVGTEGKIISIDKYGASAPGEIAMDKYGINVDNLVNAVRALL